MNESHFNLKIAIIDSSDTWYAQPRLIFNELVKQGHDVLFLGRPNHTGYKKTEIPAGYISICIANNLSPIDVFTDEPMQLNHPPLERAYYSNADFTFVGDKTIFLRFFSDRANSYYLPYAVNEIFSPLGDQPSFDVGFIGNLKFKERIRRIELLKKHYNIFVGTNHFMQDANLMMNKSKIIFNTCDGKEINMRIFEALATGRLLVTEKVQHLEELFTDGEHLVTYKNDNELIKKINFYLEADSERERIAHNGYLEVTQKHTYRHRADFIIDKLIQSKINYSKKNSHHLLSCSNYQRFYEKQSKTNVAAQERIFNYSLPDPDSDGKYNIRARLNEALKIAKGKVLDIGCQRGGYSFNLKKMGCEVTGIDISIGYLNMAKTKVGGVDFAQSNAEQLPFKSETFDTVILSEILEHVIDEKSVVDEVFRILKQDGKVFVTVPAYEDDSEEHVRFLRKSDLKRLFSKFHVEFRDVFNLKSTVLVVTKSLINNELSGYDQMNKPLKILLTNHHLLDYTGSEVYTLTIADYLKQKGCEVTVYSQYTDKIEKEFQKLNIKIIRNLNEVRNYKFDLAHVHHNINAMEVRYHFPELPIVFLSHGILPFLEQAPIVDLQISKYLAVSEEAKINLFKSDISENKVTVIGNLIDDRKFLSSKPINETPKQALVLSNRIDEQKEFVIRKACEHLRIQTMFVGGRFGEVSQDKLKILMEESDIVFSLGRGAIEAMLMGRIPIIYDYLGADGMVTSENFDEIKNNNFSGRRYSLNYSVEDLVNEIKKYDSSQAQALRQKALDDFAASKLIFKLLAIYQSCMNEKPQKLELHSSRILKFIITAVNETRNYSNEFSTRLINYDSAKYFEKEKLLIAESLLEKKEYSASRMILGDILSSDSLNTDALNDMAVIEILEKNYADAETIVNLILRIDPKNEIALGNLEYIKQNMQLSSQTELFSEN